MHDSDQVPNGNAGGVGNTPVFVVDAALGRLAKWLRIAGFDTAYDSKLSLERAKSHIASGKTLLTRNHKFYDILKEKSVIHIQSDHYLEQIQEVMRETRLEAKHIKPFSRCSICNLPTVTVSKAEVAGKVPDYIWENIDTFHLCNGCRRIYWRGSHAENILDILACF